MNLLAVLAVLASQVVLRFQDPAITESSGLVDLGGRMVTVNDSGNAPILFTVDRSGRTVARTTLGVDAVDIEALAPAGGSRVWVGDLGDNTRSRSKVSVYLASVGSGDRTVRPTSYDLVYPDGSHDAESLVDAGGRLYVITKGFTGGVYRTPATLDPEGDNRLTKVATLPILATDAAMLDDEHVIVRGYGAAVVYTFPGFERVGGFDLPAQKQGEGISVGPGGRIRLSSEGANSAVLQVALPTAIRTVLRPTPSAVPTPVATAPSTPGEPADGPVWLAAGAGLVIVGGILVALRRRR